MRTTKTRTLAGLLVAVGLLSGTTVQAAASGTSGNGLIEAQIAAMRAATQKFQDVAVALAEGYIPDPSGH